MYNLSVDEVSMIDGGGDGGNSGSSSNSKGIYSGASTSCYLAAVGAVASSFAGPVAATLGWANAMNQCLNNGN